MKILFSIPLLLGLTGAVYAQSGGECPRLSNVQLNWEQRVRGDTLLCRAIRDDGSEAFGVSITPKAPYELRRNNRLGPGTIDELNIYWYRGELAAQPGVQVRETMFSLGDGRSVHIWLQAASDTELAQTIGTVQALHFDANRLSSK